MIGGLPFRDPRDADPRADMDGRGTDRERIGQRALDRPHRRVAARRVADDRQREGRAVAFGRDVKRRHGARDPVRDRLHQSIAGGAAVGGVDDLEAGRGGDDRGHALARMAIDETQLIVAHRLLAAAATVPASG
ncbi:MAG: hypothetical protein PGN17_17865 [Sphingomonas adhaesiva]